MHLSTIFDHHCPPACRWISHGSICELSCTSVHADEVFHAFPNSCGVLSVTPTGDLLQNRSQSQKTQWIYRIVSFLLPSSPELIDAPLPLHFSPTHRQLMFQGSSLSFQAKAQKRKRRCTSEPLDILYERMDQNRPSSIFTRERNGTLLSSKSALSYS